MGGHLVRALKAIGAEDAFLGAGALLASVGAGMEFGLPAGLMAAGALCIAYGAWIARGIAARGGDG